jgi:hypothetical protein
MPEDPDGNPETSKRTKVMKCVNSVCIKESMQPSLFLLACRIGYLRAWIPTGLQIPHPFHRRRMARYSQLVCMPRGKSEDMKVLVTGATGNVGSAVVAEDLLKRGTDVRALIRKRTMLISYQRALR